MSKKTLLVLVLIVVLSFFLQFYKINDIPRCINADEASFGYNAYSILQTGADEYGQKFPLRLKSFGDYKMPLYSYLSIPFIKIFGLNDLSIRLLNKFIAILLPLVVYLLAKEAFNKTSVALLSAFMTSISLGLYIISRQAHEAYLTTFIISFACLFFIKLLKKVSLRNTIFFLIFFFLSLLSYHFTRIFIIFFIIFALAYRKKYISLLITLTLLVFFLFTLTDFIYKPERIKNLIFFNTPGFSAKINELRNEGGSGLLYNKLTVGFKDTTSEYIKYFSPQFLAINGDENYRFGFPGMAPQTIIEYIFILIGLYYLLKNKEKWRFFILGFLLFSPLSASLSWAGASLSRSLILFVPAIMILSYGAISFFTNLKPSRLRIIFIPVLALELFFLLTGWNFYFNHYQKRGVTIRASQCGYRELGKYIKDHYNKFDRFYISPEHGEPYIFLLFYLNYPPVLYQKQANLTSPDKYGFGQIEKFDKFIFTLSGSSNQKNVSLIAYPHDFSDQNIYPNRTGIKKIKIGKEEIFWIYEL